MKRMLALILLVSLFATVAFAQGTPSSKATAAINTTVYCNISNSSTLGDPAMTCHDVFSGTPVEPTADHFVPFMTTTVKVSNSQSLFVTPSLVTGLYTSTKVKSSPGGGASSATAMGGVYVRAVLYDASGKAIIAEPIKSCETDVLGCYADAQGNKGVVFDSRVQTLTQDITNCVVNVGIVTGTCTFDLTTQLILKTTSAHSFGFIFPNVGVGVYTLSIEGSVDSDAFGSGSYTSVGGAAFGLGSVTAESVRLVHGFAF